MRPHVDLKNCKLSSAWKYTPVIWAHKRLKQKDRVWDQHGLHNKTKMDNHDNNKRIVRWNATFPLDLVMVTVEFWTWKGTSELNQLNYLRLRRSLVSGVLPKVKLLVAGKAGNGSYSPKSAMFFPLSSRKFPQHMHKLCLRPKVYLQMLILLIWKKNKRLVKLKTTWVLCSVLC